MRRRKIVIVDATAPTVHEIGGNLRLCGDRPQPDAMNRQTLLADALPSFAARTFLRGGRQLRHPTWSLEPTLWGTGRRNDPQRLPTHAGTVFCNHLQRASP